MNKYKDSFCSKSLFKKLAFCLIAVFCFSLFGAVSASEANAINLNEGSLSEVNSKVANPKAVDDFAVSITKIGSNSIKIDLQTPPGYGQDSIQFNLSNSFYRETFYQSGTLDGNVFEYTFNNVVAGNYKATAWSFPYGIPLETNDTVNIYLNAVDRDQFNDISDQPADSQEQINWIANYGITTGYQDGGYHPSGKVSREQMASFIYRSAGKPSVAEVENPFVDLADNEHKNAILWAVSLGIIQGYDCTAKGKPYKACTKKGDKIFYGSKFITRSQLALEIYRYFGSPFSDLDINKYLDKITDSSKLTNDEQKQAVACLIKNSIISGYADGQYKPNNTVSRVQMAKFMAYSSQNLAVAPFLKIENFREGFLNTGVARSAITKIEFIDYLPVCSSPIDVSYGDTGAILACVNGSEITIGQIGGVMVDSFNNGYLFANFNSNLGVSLNLRHLNVHFTRWLDNMFYHFGKINSIIFPDNFGQNAKSALSMFDNVIFPSGIIFPAKFAWDCEIASGMFRSATLPADFSLPQFLMTKNNGKYGSAIMSYMFDSTVFAPGFSFPDDFGMNVVNLSYIFVKVNFPAGFHLPKNFATVSSGSTHRSLLYYAFAYSKIPSSLVFPKNFGSTEDTIQRRDILMDNMFKGAVFPENYSFPENFGKYAHVEYMLSKVVIPGGFTLPDDFCSYSDGQGMFSEAVIPADFKVPTFKLNYESYPPWEDLKENMFEKATIASGWTLPVGFFQNAGSGDRIFNGAIFQGPFVLPNDFGINYSISSTFINVNLSYNIDWSAADLTDKGTNLKDLFTDAVWNDHVVLVKNEASKDALIAGGAPADRVQIKV
ncbi:MAG: S-layer homology domain-containing protein [Bifidobacteriaceae bacterium]|nr:S-layer homology domain-containing protein [Bifidobacteriaceae bacterium]